MDLPVKIKIYPVQHITILELVYREYKPLIYKADTYRGKKKRQIKSLKSSRLLKD